VGSSKKTPSAQGSGQGQQFLASDNGARPVTPPHNLDAERAVLGSCLIDKDAISTAADYLTPKDFYSTAHQRIFEAILKLWGNGTVIDLMTVYDELCKVEQIEEIGGLAYLSCLEQYVMTTTNVGHHAFIVREKARKRRLISEYVERLNETYQDSEDTDVIIETSFENLTEINLDSPARSVRPAAPIVEEIMAQQEDLRNDKRNVSGLRTGLDHLDGMTLGLHNGELILIAARPSQGKTALAGTIAANVAVAATQQTPVGIFSLEMSAEAIMQRVLSTIARIPGKCLRTGKYTPEQWRRLTERVPAVQSAPILIDDTPGITSQILRARARRIASENPDLGLLIVDYIQLMRGSERAGREGRQREVAEIAGDLKSLARELDIPVIGLSQLSRDPEKGFGKPRKPRLSDLRDSGALEQDADVVMFIHRDLTKEYREKPFDHEFPETNPSVVADLIIGKQRNGPVGEIQLQFFRQFTHFDTLDRASWRQDPEDAAGQKPPKGVDEIIAVLRREGAPLAPMDIRRKLEERLGGQTPTGSTLNRWISIAAQSGAIVKVGGQYRIAEEDEKQEEGK
jgi:replicative DNA helicase